VQAAYNCVRTSATVSVLENLTRDRLCSCVGCGWGRQTAFTTSTLAGGRIMSTAVAPAAERMDLRALHQRMGRVYHQPVRVHSFTNKRFTVNFRVPLDQLRRIVPGPVLLDEIGDSGLGMLSMCACDFWVSRFGWLP